ncbi:MAG TPA: AAA family ATPase, partial [Candidatus Eremiobacteraeota bacterium]|nr:AAA family ATPase [Candidatus Eremiobacteraeota bacterium]
GTESVSTEELKPFKVLGKDEFLRNSISDFIDFIKSKQGRHSVDSKDKLLQNTAAYFKNYTNAILSTRGDYEDIINYFNVNGIDLKIGETKIQGFSLSRFEESKFHVEVPYNKIVGNSDIKRIGLEAIYNVMSMGPGETKNPLMPFMQYFIIIGSSGCGKTVTIMAMFNEAMNIAKAHDLPAEVVIIMGSKFKSEYQNKSANEFRRIFTDRIWKPDKRRFVYMPDFDTMMPSRKAKDARQEDNQLVGEALNIIDGPETPRTGHFVVFADVNLVGDDETSSIDILDPAIYTRFFKISAKGAETEEDYKNLFLDVCLEDAMKEGYVFMENIKEDNPFWTSYGSDELNNYISQKLKQYKGIIKPDDLMKEISQLCVDNKVAGRDVANISKEVASYGKWFDKTKIPGFFRMSNEEKIKIIPEHYRKVHIIYIMKELLSLLKLQEGQKQKDWLERKKRLKDSYILEKEVLNELEKTWEKEYESKEGSVVIYGDK